MQLSDVTQAGTLERKQEDIVSDNVCLVTGEALGSRTAKQKAICSCMYMCVRVLE